MLKKEFSVKVLSSTDEKDMVKVFQLSRPQLLHYQDGWITDSEGNILGSDLSYLKKLIDFDLSLSYFPVYNLSIESSILIRDFFYSFNTLGRWAFTHRNGMPKLLYSSSEVYDQDEEETYNIFRSKIDEYKSDEIDFDTARGYMPLSLSTQWSISISMKELIRILGYLHSYIGECETFHIIWLGFMRGIPSFSRWSHLIAKYDYDSFTDYSLNLITHKDIGFNLYAQLIRHEGVYASGIGEFLIDYLDTRANNICSSPIKVDVYASPKRWREVLKVRTAWFSMTDNWGDPNSWSIFLKDVLTGDLDTDKPYIKYFNDLGRFDDSSIKSYSIDDNLRVRRGKTPYFPDAFALQSRKIIEDRIKARGDNPLFQDYLQIFDKYCTDDPDNELRKKWEEIQNDQSSHTS